MEQCQRLRFSLRSLLLVVTGLCLFFGYQLEWIRKRHQFLDQQALLWAPYAPYTGPDMAHFQLAPPCLWLFRERGYCSFAVLLSEGVYKKDDELGYYCSKSHPTLVRGRTLFAEAKVFPSVERDGVFHVVVEE